MHMTDVNANTLGDLKRSLKTGYFLPFQSFLVLQAVLITEKIKLHN